MKFEKDFPTFHSFTKTGQSATGGEKIEKITGKLRENH